MPTSAWDNTTPIEAEKISLAASRIRTFKRDVRERIDENVPIGLILEWFTETAPDGFLECNGQSITVAAFPDLFLQLGYRFGGSGANFNVPDCRGILVRCWRHAKSGVDLDADAATSCTADIAAGAVTAITGLAGVPRIGAVVSGAGIAVGTVITGITTFGADGIPTAFTISDAAAAGAAVALTIDNDQIGSTQYDENMTHQHSVKHKLSTIWDLTIHNFGNIFTTGSSGGNESRPKNMATMYIIRSDTV
jgi:microcystin-dependent protein